MSSPVNTPYSFFLSLRNLSNSAVKQLIPFPEPLQLGFLSQLHCLPLSLWSCSFTPLQQVLTPYAFSSIPCSDWTGTDMTWPYLSYEWKKAMGETDKWMETKDEWDGTYPTNSYSERINSGRGEENERWMRVNCQTQPLAPLQSLNK